MTLTPTGCAILVIVTVSAIVMAYRDDPRAGEWIREIWADTVGAWFARRRQVGRFCDKRHARIRVGAPDEHSAGIMTARRDTTTGVGV